MKKISIFGKLEEPVKVDINNHFNEYKNTFDFEKVIKVIDNKKSSWNWLFK